MSTAICAMSPHGDHLRNNLRLHVEVKAAILEEQYDRDRLFRDLYGTGRLFWIPGYRNACLSSSLSWTVEFEENALFVYNPQILSHLFKQQDQII